MQLSFRSIDFRVGGFNPNETAYQNVLNIVSPAMSHLLLNGNDVLKIIIADDSNYGPAIQEVSSSAAFTNDGVYTGVGKAVPQIRSDKYAGSIVVLHSSAIASFMTSDLDKPSGEADSFRYIVFHELGHCVDYRRRQGQHFWQLGQNTNSETLSLADANSRTLLGEYAACFFSASFVSGACFEYSADSATECLREYLRLLSLQREQYRRHALGLRELRDAALLTFWRGLIEFGKLFAYIHGNPALKSTGFAVTWPDGNSRSNIALAQMEAKLRELWALYPNCDAEFSKAVTDAWFTVAEAEGFRFEVKRDGDCLWLQ